VLKVLKAGRLSEARKTQIRQKIEHLKVLNDPLVIRPASFSGEGDVWFLTQDYFEGAEAASFGLNCRSSVAAWPVQAERKVLRI
jgi:hypothetical protein